MSAETNAQTNQPGAEHQKLSPIVGKWTVEGMEDSFVEICEWYPGGYFVVCNSESKTKTGIAKGVSVLGYSKEEKLYTYYHYGSTGSSQTLRCNIIDNVFNFFGEETVNGNLTKTKVTMTPQGDNFHFKEEISVNDGPWKTTASFMYVRLKD